MNIGRALKYADDLARYDVSLENDEQRKRRMVVFDAVVNPIPTNNQKLSVDEAKETGCEIIWRSFEEYADITDVVTKQPYVYRTQLKWYISNPEFLEVPHPHNKGSKEVEELATILFCDGVKRMGNGNHRVAAALLLGRTKLKIRHLEVKEVLPRADISGGVLCDSVQQSKSSQGATEPNVAENLTALVKTICPDVLV